MYGCDRQPAKTRPCAGARCWGLAPSVGKEALVAEQTTQRIASSNHLMYLL
jgi:hypothetical protein